MNKQLNIGLIGCGHLGMIHCKLLKQISDDRKDINFVGVYDSDNEHSEKASNDFSVKSYSSFESLLNDIDTLVIVTPTSTHFEIAKEALSKGKNIFIEKPVTETFQEAKMLLTSIDNSELKIQVGHVERFNPALVALENFAIKPMFIESHRLAQFNPRGTDVSVIQDLMIHDIDIILNLVQSPVSKIDANGVAVISDNIDIANTRLTFENGCVANITASRISLKKMRKMRLFQGNSYISIDFLNNKSEVFRLTDSKAEIKGTMTFPFTDEKKIVFEQPQPDSSKELNPIKNELNSFFESILNDTKVKVSLEEGKQAIEVAEKIIEIIESNKK